MKLSIDEAMPNLAACRTILSKKIAELEASMPSSSVTATPRSTTEIPPSPRILISRPDILRVKLDKLAKDLKIDNPHEIFEEADQILDAMPPAISSRASELALAFEMHVQKKHGPTPTQEEITKATPLSRR